jgi:hypothetical protein
MAEETTPPVEETPPPVEPTAAENDGVSMDELRTMVGEVVEEKLSAIGNIGGLKDEILSEVGKLFETNKQDGSGLLAQIGELIDSKLKGAPAPSSNGEAKPREPKLKVF